MASSDKEWLTGVVFNERLATHFNAWNKDFTERPQRITRSIERCNEFGLLQRCKRIRLRNATEDEILTCHTKKHIELLKSTENMNEEQLKAISQKYDYIYFHEKSYENAVLALGGIIDLVDEVASGKIRNGMAIVRPPGHHAMEEEFCGYCYFSNIAISAQIALDKYHLKRILIFDWDVHHGQGSQFKFYNDPRVLFVSIHRYEHGEEWPCLRESDYDYIGEGPGRGYTINVPLNEVGFGNDEYLSVFFNLLLPVFYEFDPELVLISSGFDCAIGCPEGEMTVTPACFAHFVNMLMPLASGKLVLALEGGYNLKSLSESVALSLRALLGDPAPNIAPLSAPKPSVVESVLNCIKVLHPYWRSLRYQDLLDIKDIIVDNYPFSGVLNLPPVKDVKFSTPESRPESFPLIQECADEIVFKQLESWNNFLDDLIQNTVLHFAESRLSIGSDRKDSHLCRYLKMKALWSQCLSLEENLPDSPNASDCVKACVDSVLSCKVQCSLCLVQACLGYQNGTTNGASSVWKSNIDLALQYATAHDGIQKILVIQFGSPPSHQQLCHIQNSSVCYIYLTWPGVWTGDSAQFTEDIDCKEKYKTDISSQGVHICIRENAMTNGDLLSVMFQIILPVSYEFCPDLVILTWRNPLGSIEVLQNLWYTSYLRWAINVFDALLSVIRTFVSLANFLEEVDRESFTPSCMGHITQLLRGLAQGRLLLLIENENSRYQPIGDSTDGPFDIGSEVVAECASVMLGAVPGKVGQIVPSEGAVAEIKHLQDYLKSHWKVFQFRHSLPKVQI